MFVDRFEEERLKEQERKRFYDRMRQLKHLLETKKFNPIEAFFIETYISTALQKRTFVDDRKNIYLTSNKKVLNTLIRVLDIKKTDNIKDLLKAGNQYLTTEFFSDCLNIMKKNFKTPDTVLS